MTSNAARRLAKSLNNTRTQQTTTDDPMAVEMMQKLEHLGMGKYLPDEPDPDEERRQAMRDLAELHSSFESGEYYRNRDAQRQAEAEAERVSQLPVAARLAAALRGPSSDPMPLNGPRVTDKVKRALR